MKSIFNIFKKMLLYGFILLFVLAVAVYWGIRQDPFGKIPEGKALEKISQSTHYQDGIFVNLEKTSVESPEMSYWELIKLYLKSDHERTPTKPLPAQKHDLSYPNTQKTKITWFGHSSILLQTAGKNILIDPIFSERASPVQFFGSKNYEGTAIYQVSDLPPIDFVLISHDHYDHLDYPTIVALKEKVGHFYVPLGVGAHLQHWGITNLTELDWWQEVEISPEILLVATPARHFSGRSINDRFKTLWASYVIKTSTESLYFSGDSGYGKHFKEIGKKYAPFDFAMLECGQYHRFWHAIHMMPEETVQAQIDLKARLMMPIHWGKFTLALHDWQEPIRRAKTQADKVGAQMLTPQIGEPIYLDSLSPKNIWWE